MILQFRLKKLENVINIYYDFEKPSDLVVLLEKS